MSKPNGGEAIWWSTLCFGEQRICFFFFFLGWTSCDDNDIARLSMLGCFQWVGWEGKRVDSKKVGRERVSENVFVCGIVLCKWHVMGLSSSCWKGKGLWALYGLWGQLGPTPQAHHGRLLCLLCMQGRFHERERLLCSPHFGSICFI